MERSMKRAVAAALLSLLMAVPAVAQTKGRVSVGGTVTWVKPTDSEVGSLVGVGALVRLNPKKGWGVAGGLSWFRADVENPVGGGDLAKLRVRPLMGGVSYTIGEQPVLVSFSVVAGPSFNSLDFDDDFLDRLPPGPRPSLDAEDQLRGAARRGSDLDGGAACCHRRLRRLLDQPPGPRLSRRQRRRVPQSVEGGRDFS